MKLKIESNTLRGLLINLSLVAGLLIILSFTFFCKVLPTVTNKDRIVSVPDLKGMTFEQAKKFLETRELAYEVTDSAYNSEEAPLTVLEQFPRPLSKVKIDRKINLKLNARTAPLIVAPDLTGSTFNFAQIQLKALDIKIGSVKYRPDIAVNSVVEMLLNGKSIQAGDRIQRGSKIDLIIGSSTNKTFALPDFTGMPYDEVEVHLLGLNLEVGEIHDVQDDKFGDNIVQRQSPSAGDSVKHFDKVELWVYNLQKVN